MTLVGNGKNPDSILWRGTLLNFPSSSGFSSCRQNEDKELKLKGSKNLPCNFHTCNTCVGGGGGGAFLTVFVLVFGNLFLMV